MSDQGALPCRERLAQHDRFRRRAAALAFALGLLVSALLLGPRPAAAAPSASMSDLLGPGPLAGLLGSVQPRLAGAATVIGSITPGGPPVSATFAAGDSVQLGFTAAAGQRVSVLATNVSMTGYQYGCCLGQLSVYNSAGQRVSGASGSWVWVGTDGGFLDVVPLSAGSYTLVFQPQSSTTAGSLTLTMYDVPPDPAPVVVPTTAGTVVTVANSAYGQNMLPTFQGRAGQRIAVWTRSSSFSNVQNACCGVTIRVRRQSDWSQIGGWAWIDAVAGGWFDTVQLPTDGTYVLVVDPPGISTGSATLTVYDVPPDPRDVLVLNGPGVRLTAGTPGQGLAATFSGAPGQQVTVRLSSVTVVGAGNDGCCSTKVWIANPDGSSVTSHTYLGTGGGTIGATLPAAATYTVVVDPQGPATGAATLDLTGPGVAAPSGSDTFGPNVCASGRGLHARSATACLQDPVNSATGAYTASATDLTLPGTGVSFALVRSYTSADPTRGRLGQGWTDSYSASLAFQANGDVVLHGEDGQQVTYVRQADGSYVGSGGALSTLTATGGGYRLVRPDQVVYGFDGAGRLTSLVDRNGSGLSFGYTGAQMTTITDGAGRQISLTYNADGTVAKVAVPDGRSVAYGYANGLLASVVDPAGRTTTYSYDGAGRLTRQVDPDGHAVVQNTYGPDGRVAQQLDALGNRTTFAWDAASGTETVVDARGGRWQDVYANGVLARRVDAAGNVTAFTYDGSFDEIGVTAPDGNAVTLAYDGRGNLTSVSSAALTATKSFAYDAKNDITRVTDALGKITSSTYDGAGNLTAIVQDGETVARYAYDPAGRRTGSTDGRGGTTSFAYDTQGNLVSLTDPLGAKTTFAYDAAGRLVTRTDPLGNAVEYAYDAAGQLVAETDARGAKTTYTYDGAGNSTSVTDANGHRTTFAYDGANRLVSSTAADGGVTSYTYDEAGNQVTVTDPNGHTTTSAYDTDNRLARTMGPLGEVTAYAYDADGNLASVTDPRGGTTSYTYDAAGRLLSETDPLGAVTSHRYDAVGNEVAVVDPLGHTRTSVYDGRGRLASTSAADGSTDSYSYDVNGNLVARTDENGRTWTSSYDADDRLVSETTPLGEKTSYRYDVAGNLVATVDPRGNVSGADPSQYTTSSSYDAAGRLLSVSDPLGGAVEYAYDAVGNRISVTDANGHRTGFAYDALNRLVAVTAADSTVTRYAYDAAGNVVGRTDANGHSTIYSFDADNRRVGVTSPLGRRWSFSYDPAGNLSSTVDANGNATATAGDGTTSYTYDAVGRLTAIGYSDGTPAVTFAYDAAGNRTAMQDGGGTVTYTYDAVNRLLQASRGADVISYSYDAAGNVTQRSYAGGGPVSSTFDADGRLSGVTAGGASTTYAYDASGRIAQVSFPNGYTEVRSYDRAGRLVESKAAKGNSVLADFKVTLDPEGNPTAVERSGSSPATVTYGYDSLDRLTSACFQAACTKNNDPLVRWTYDPLGNRLTEKRGATTTTYAYDAGDELVSAGSVAYTYDANGNELSAGSRTFTYDLANRLVSTTSGSTTTTYHYDGDGIRLDATTGGQKTAYLWDASGPLPELVLERDGSGGFLRRYVYGAGRISMTTPGGSFYYHRDPVGSVTNVTSSTGKTQWTELYEPFGAVRSETRNDPQAPANPMKFAGEYQDATGLYNLRAREYDPASGRFLQVDPAGPDISTPITSAYAYAVARPTTLVDPSGRIPLPADDGVCGADFAASPAEDAVGCGSKRDGQIGIFGSHMDQLSDSVNVNLPSVRRAMVRHLLLEYINWTKAHLNRVPPYVFGGGRPITWALYSKPLAFPGTDCSGFVTLLYLWASSGDPAYDPNGRGFTGEAYTGYMQAAGNGRTIYYARDHGAPGSGTKSNAKAGDLVVWGPGSHVAIFAQDWVGERTMMLSHGGPWPNHPFYETFADVDRRHSSQPRWFRAYL
jgi:RHS repeat-associated protein